MPRKRYSYSERNNQLMELDVLAGRHGRLRLRRNDCAIFAATDKQEFMCLDCGAGSEGGWEMQFDNVKIGKGCPICAVSYDLIRDVKKCWPDYRLLVIADPVGRPVSARTRYRIVPQNDPLPQSFGWVPDEMSRSAIASGIRNRIRPGRRQDAGYERSLRVYENWTKAFPSQGTIRYAAKKKPNSTSPGPFFAIDTERRRMRASICDPYMSARGVLQICTQEQEDEKLDHAFRAEAAKFGATITGYNTDDVLGLRIEYVSRGGFPRNDPPSRAREVLWGQTLMRKGEKLCAIILKEFFPAADWKLNGRHSFLNYCAKDKASRNLELDGYAESLKIAFEYQGDHHFNARDETSEAALSVEEIRARDKFKVDACRLAGINLLVVPEMDLDPEHFVKELEKILLEQNITPTNSAASTNAIWDGWNAWCQNPLADFQSKVIANLNGHRLISPEKEKIAKRSMVTYECANCGAKNSTIAKNLAEGAPRTACVECKGEVAGKTRRDAILDTWESLSELPKGFIENLRENSTLGVRRYVCVRNHEINIRDLEFARRHVIDGEFRCPECEGISMGVSASQVATQRQLQELLVRDVESIGLSIIEFKPPEGGQVKAMVVCPNQHNFVVTRQEVDRLMANECMNDPPVVPCACHDCCYPGVPRTFEGLLRSTVHHRLASLRGLYPKVTYMGGFDTRGNSVEIYNCGKLFADGTPHPDFQISWKNLQKAGTGARAKNHLCPACGILAGQVIGGRKTIKDVATLVHAFRDVLHQKYPPKAELLMSLPVVSHVSGPIDKSTQEIVSQKTVLKIWCGTDGHRAVEATKDSYFNRAPTKGHGFCPSCVTEAELTKAPLPLPPNEPLPKLARCHLREEAPANGGKRRVVQKRRFQGTNSES